MICVTVIMNRFNECLKFVLAREGGESNVVGDRGGRTLWGITQGTLDAWCKQTEQDRIFISNLNEVQRDNIYQLLFWQPPCCYALPDRLALVVFDSAVQHGTRRAIEMLQTQLGVKVDHMVGKVTLKTASECNDRRIALAIIDQRRKFYERIVERDPSQGKFLRGWLNRMDLLTTEISK